MTQLSEDQRFIWSIIEDKMSSIVNDLSKIDAKNAKIEGLDGL